MADVIEYVDDFINEKMSFLAVSISLGECKRLL